MSRLDMKGKAVLITGAREGIGGACAREFLRRGAKLSLLDRNPAPPEYDDGGALWTIGDVTDEAVRRAAVDATVRRFGAIDVLVNNAGIGLYASATQTSTADAERMFAVNVSSVVGLSALAIPYMRRQRSGAIVNIESIGSVVSMPWCALYCASKHALHAYSRSLRHELRDDGIQVVSILPGIVRTRFREHVLGGAAAPAGVLNVRQSVSAESIAKSVCDAVERGRATVFNPWYGIGFWAVDRLFPPLMRAYVRRCWTPPAAKVAHPTLPHEWMPEQR